MAHFSAPSLFLFTSTLAVAHTLLHIYTVSPSYIRYLHSHNITRIIMSRLHRKSPTSSSSSSSALSGTRQTVHTNRTPFFNATLTCFSHGMEIDVSHPIWVPIRQYTVPTRLYSHLSRRTSTASTHRLALFPSSLHLVSPSTTTSSSSNVFMTPLQQRGIRSVGKTQGNKKDTPFHLITSKH